jgi:hypothetical protein
MQRHDDLLERLTQCHQSQIVEAALAQPVGGGERALAAAATKDNAP